MARRESIEAAVHRMATAHAGVTLGVACKGTSLESTTFNVNAKAFVFLRETADGYELRLKITGAWKKLELAADAAPPAALEKHIAASYAAMAPKPKPVHKARKRA